MNLPKPVSPKVHSLIDYALVGSLLTLPSVFGFSKKVKQIYAAEGLALLGYIAITEQPAAIKPIIPFRIHGKIDPFNIAHFALQTFFPAFRKDKRAQRFNAAFTLVAGTVVALTDWNGRTKPED